MYCGRALRASQSAKHVSRSLTEAVNWPTAILAVGRCAAAAQSLGFAAPLKLSRCNLCWLGRVRFQSVVPPCCCQPCSWRDGPLPSSQVWPRGQHTGPHGLWCLHRDWAWSQESNSKRTAGIRGQVQMAAGQQPGELPGHGAAAWLSLMRESLTCQHASAQARHLYITYGAAWDGSSLTADTFLLMNVVPALTCRCCGPGCSSSRVHITGGSVPAIWQPSAMNVLYCSW